MLVLDRDSIDGTIDIAKANGAKVVRAGTNRSSARNLGVHLASSPNVLFVDSDMALAPTLIEECKDALGRYQAVIIPEISIGNGFWAKCRSLERNSYHEGANLIEAARCFRKTDFLSLGGYNPCLDAGEDWDLHNRARMGGLAIGRVQSRIIHDEGNLTLIAILKKKFFYGKALGEYFKLNPQVGMKQANPVSRLLTPCLKSVPSDPVHGIGILLLKSVEFTAAGLGHLKRISEEELTPVASLQS